MAAVYLAPLYLLVNYYIFRRLIRWLGAISPFFKKRWPLALIIVVYLFLACAMLAGFLLPHSRAEWFLKQIGNYWLGVLLYTILTLAVAELLRFLLKRSRHINQNKLQSTEALAWTGSICLCVILLISSWGVINARNIHVTKYDVTIHKSVDKMDTLKVVLTADLHLGYNTGCRQMKQMVEKINAQEPDIVVIAGDIFDNQYDALDDPQKLASILRGIKSRYGVYAVLGNHDVDEKILAGFTFSGKKEEQVSDPRMDALLKEADITLLRDEAVLIHDSFYIYGRPDASRPGRGITTRKTPQEITAALDKSKPILVLDHQPRQLQELADAGVDLDLCGHTHDGQVFPGNLVVRLFWENPCGYLQKGQMHSIVTAGAGVFGPNMRVGTKAEICSITVHFE
ncbi:MAG: metallophosphoesterase [Coprococcus sp.]|nr:metallophosphoesterase [Coprococcus sp.]